MIKHNPHIYSIDLIHPGDVLHTNPSTKPLMAKITDDWFAVEAEAWAGFAEAFGLAYAGAGIGLGTAHDEMLLDAAGHNLPISPRDAAKAIGGRDPATGKRIPPAKRAGIVLSIALKAAINAVVGKTHKPLDKLITHATDEGARPADRSGHEKALGADIGQEARKKAEFLETGLRVNVRIHGLKLLAGLKGGRELHLDTGMMRITKAR